MNFQRSDARTDVKPRHLVLTCTMFFAQFLLNSSGSSKCSTMCSNSANTFNAKPTETNTTEMKETSPTVTLCASSSPDAWDGSMMLMSEITVSLAKRRSEGSEVAVLVSPYRNTNQMHLMNAWLTVCVTQCMRDYVCMTPWMQDKINARLNTCVTP